jgi:hypothetical protein
MNPIVLLRVLGVLLVVRLLGRFVVAVLQGLRQQTATGPGPGAPAGSDAGEMVRDRICNTFVPRERALRALIGGQEAHFCSAACRDRALVPQP